MLPKLKEEFLVLKNGVSDLLKNIDRSKFTHLQNYIYFAHHPVFSFTEAIVILCENKKPHVAEVLLRTLFELHIDVIYHQLDDTETRLALSARRVFDERIIILQEIQKIIKDYSNLESKKEGDLFNKEYLRGAIEDQEVHRRAIVKGNPSIEKVKKVNLQEKAKLCDEGEVKGGEKGHFNRMYSLIYRQLSPVSHLNIEGLQVFIGKDEYGETFFSDGDNHDFVAGQAIDICIAFTKDLYDNEILTGSVPEVVNRLEDLTSSK